MSEANKEIIRQFIDQVWNHGNLDLADQLVAPEYEINTGKGPEAVKRNVREICDAFPDLQVSVDDLIAEGDRVVAQMTLRGTHLGTFREQHQPTGRQATWSEVGIWKVRNGRLVSGWFVADALGLRRQLGIIPADLR